MEAGRDRQRQVEAGKVVGNVLSLYIPFISYQFSVHLYSQLVFVFFSCEEAALEMQM